jgi:hypothetical protein
LSRRQNGNIPRSARNGRCNDFEQNSRTSADPHELAGWPETEAMAVPTLAIPR